MIIGQPAEPVSLNNVFTIYEKATGEVTCILETRDKQPPLLPTIDYIEGAYDGGTYYVDIDTGNPIEKPSLDTEFDVTTGPPGTVCTMTGLPNPITLQVDGKEKYEITDGTIEISMTTVGGYTVETADYRYLHRVWELSCV